MPESRFDPSDALVPEPPDGYAPPTPFRYSLVAVIVLSVVLFVAAVDGFGWVLLEVRGLESLDPIITVETVGDVTSVIFGGGQFWLAILTAFVGVAVLHEGIHGLVYRLRGFDVSYGVAPQLGAFYAAAFHQFQTPRDNLLAGIAPLVVLDLALLPLLFVPVPFVAFTAFVALVLNTAGAAGDLYLVAKLLRLPEGALLYDSDMRHMYVFRPEETG